MRRLVRLASVNDFAEWRAAARGLLLEGVVPGDVEWADPARPSDLLSELEPPAAAITERKAGRVPSRFITLAQVAICHADPDRFALLYSLLWRLQKDRRIMFDLNDTDIGKLNRRVQAVVAECRRMQAELRFQRTVAADGHKGLTASFAPRHYVLERVAPNFAREVAHEDWLITTPYRSAYWDHRRRRLSYGEGSAPVAVTSARSRNPPPTPFIASSIVETEETMPLHSETHVRARRPLAPLDTEGHEDIVSLADARAAVQGCRRCPLYEFATQAVFGEGPEQADIMFVGEQPGDQEDVQGRPFVGPAGRLFDRALERAGIDRRRTYVTNAVKHFKFVPRGKRRLHQRPNGGEIAACRFWLNLEREFVKPRVIVALGATAVQGVLGRVATITSLRGKPIELDDGSILYVTIHPSFLLRIREEPERRAEERAFEADLRKIRTLAGEKPRETQRLSA